MSQHAHTRTPHPTCPLSTCELPASSCLTNRFLAQDFSPTQLITGDHKLCLTVYQALYICNGT